MKVIESLGGPLIGLDRDHMHLWTGTDSKGFIGEQSPFTNDYEAASELINGRRRSPCNVAKINGTVVDGLLITMPLQTAVIAADGNSIYIAQVEFAEENWSFSMVSTSDFDKAVFDPTQDVHFSSEACTYIFFDAAYSGDDIKDDCISFELHEGNHILSSSVYSPHDSLGLILCQITTA